MSDEMPKDDRDSTQPASGLLDQANAIASRGLIGALCGGAISVVAAAVTEYFIPFDLDARLVKVLATGAGIGLLVGTTCGGLKLRGKLKSAAIGGAAGLLLGGLGFGLLLFPQLVRVLAPDVYQHSLGKESALGHGSPASFLVYPGVAIGGSLGVLLGAWVGIKFGAKAHRSE